MTKRASKHSPKTFVWCRHPNGEIDGEAFIRSLLFFPGGFAFLRFMNAAKSGRVPQAHIDTFGSFLGRMFVLLGKAIDGDDFAQNQVKVIDKILFPSKYELPQNIIEELAVKYQAQPLWRAWELRELMLNLSGIVTPIGGGELESTTQTIRLVSEPSEWRKSLFDEAKPHARRGMTLQSLAIKIYLERCGREDFADVTNISERSLKRDLKKAREWEAANSTSDLLPKYAYSLSSTPSQLDKELLIFPYLDGSQRAEAKQRGAKKRRGDKKARKLS